MSCLVSLLWLALLFLTGFCGYLLFKRFGLPSAPILGPITAVSILNLAGAGFPTPPASYDFLIQIGLGFFLGLNICRENIRELKAVVLPASITAAWALFITFAFGYFLYAATSLDLATAVLSSSPGGAPEVSIIALAVGGDVATVTVMQMARLLAVVFVVPFLVRRSSAVPQVQCGRETAAVSPAVKPWFTNPGLLFALAGGWLLYRLGVPAGAMIGAMAAVGLAALLGAEIRTLPMWVRLATYIGAGVLIGVYFTREAAIQMAGVYPYVAVLTLLMLLSSVVLAFFVQRITGWRFAVCLLAAAPGGLVTMTAMADNLGADPVKVSLLHAARLVTIKATLPLVIALISQ